ncbi:MAG: zinc ribbon domain-containing protein [Planctomycetaceae bacterium]
MPIFEYQCAECDRQFEQLVRADEQVQCPACRSLKLEKLLSVPSGHVGANLPLACPPPSAPPCGPGCCRIT